MNITSRTSPLSTFSDYSVTYKGTRYKCAEGAYQANKGGKHIDGFELLTGIEAKRLGSGAPVDKAKNIDLMVDILHIRFKAHIKLTLEMARVLSLGEPLVHNTIARDLFWETVDGKGKDMFIICLREAFTKFLGFTIKYEDA